MTGEKRKEKDDQQQYTIDAACCYLRPFRPLAATTIIVTDAGYRDPIEEESDRPPEVPGRRIDRKGSDGTAGYHWGVIGGVSRIEVIHQFFRQEETLLGTHGTVSLGAEEQVNTCVRPRETTCVMTDEGTVTDTRPPGVSRCDGVA